MTKPLSPYQLKTAQEIDAEVVRLLKLDGEEALLMGMLPIMAPFKKMMDSAHPGQLDLLCDRFVGLAHFAKLLEAMALGIEAGNFNDILG